MTTPTNPIADIPSEFWPLLLKTAAILGGCNPLHLVKVWFSESEMRSNAHNKNGDAVGIFQAMPATLQGLGFPGVRNVLQTPKGPQPQLTRGWQGFLMLNAADQLTWARAYYRPYSGRLGSVGQVYLATFLPAELVEHTAAQLTDDFVTCSKATAVDRGILAWAYDANTVLDDNHDGKITLGELGQHAESRWKGPRAAAIEAELVSIMGAAFRNDGESAIPKPAPEASQPSA